MIFPAIAPSNALNAMCCFGSVSSVRDSTYRGTPGGTRILAYLRAARGSLLCRRSISRAGRGKMPVEAKICGLKDPAAVMAAVRGGARYVGFNFYPPSPRSIRSGGCGGAGRAVAGPCRSRRRHGRSERCRDRRGDGCGQARDHPASRLGIAGAGLGDRGAHRAQGHQGDQGRHDQDVASAARYASAVDRLLFDTKPIETSKDALPGGTGRSFDWSLMKGFASARPWMLSGGLNAGNVAEAVAISGAKVVDVSSGVETAPGKKSPERIAAFLDAVRAL